MPVTQKPGNEARHSLELCGPDEAPALGVSLIRALR